jgi:prepilin-type processing-associated H-X9-DG protein
VLPGLARARRQAEGAACLNHLRQLNLALQMYAGDHADVLPANNWVYYVDDMSPLSRADSWAPGLAPVDRTASNLAAGLLFPYLRQPAVYRCPADRARVTSTNGEPAVPRTRSYNLSQSVNCDLVMNRDGAPMTYRKLTQITDPPPAELLTFLDVHEDTILDSMFGMPLPGEQWDGRWFDVPANRHSQGGNLSFADGRAERRRWRHPKAAELFFQPVANDADRADFLSVQAGLRVR